MEDKNELSDIVLEKNSNKNSNNIKKIILLVALLIVVFLVVLIAMKIINKPAEQKQQALSLPPAPTTTVKEEKSGEQLFEQVPIKKEEDNFEKIVQKLKTQDTQTAQKPTPPKPPVQKEQVSKPIEAPKKEVVKKPEPVKKQEAPKKAEPTPSVTPSLYIQVGATLKQKPSDKFLNSIKEAGYKHTLYRVKIGDKVATKILVGPYKDRSEANTHMPAIKAKINKEAFLYRVKN